MACISSCAVLNATLGFNRATENVTITNCVVSGYVTGTLLDGTYHPYGLKSAKKDAAPPGGTGRIKFGTEANGGFRNITISGNVMEGSKGIALESSDGAWLEDIAITGNTLRDTIDAPLFLRLNRRNRGPKETMRPGTLRRIVISNLVSYNSAASTASIFHGLPENMIEDVKISNCYFGHEGLPTKMRIQWGAETRPMPDWHTIQVPELEAAYPELLQFGPTPSNGFFIRHLRNLEMSHVEIAPANPDPRPAFWLEDTHRTDFFAVTAPAQANFSLHNVTDFRIGWSRATKDTTLPTTDNQLL